MDDLKPRPQALLDFIHVYMMKYGGRPPTIREMIEGKIGKFTEAGVFTSKSVIRYNLQKLEDAGRLICAKDGTARNITVPGGSFGIPWNVLHGIGIEKYKTRVVGVDTFNGQFSRKAKNSFYSWYIDNDVSVYTFTLRRFATNLWNDIGYVGAHLQRDHCYQVLGSLIEDYGIDFHDFAVITADHFERITAIGFNMAVFDPDEVFNGTE